MVVNWMEIWRQSIEKTTPYALSASRMIRYLAQTTAAERLAMMWPLAKQAWAFKEEPVGDTRLRRDIVRVIRFKH